MHSFPELIKKIRKTSTLTQKEFADVLGVSTILISMIEIGQKEVSKNFIIKLSKKLGVNPSSIIPFLYIYKDIDNKNISEIEKKFIEFGEGLQDYLINKKAKNLKKYAAAKQISKNKAEK
ncbi:MAG: helix-turn-helix transcriptional regulator [Patescibacteria group bacterium]|nr:helix-turn-helix transcriptional regulator [Patescibacteria group bacterium]